MIRSAGTPPRLAATTSFSATTAKSCSSALPVIRTTDTSAGTGGADIIRGNRGNDVIFGGVNGSTADARDQLSGDEGEDIILGDNGVVAYNDNANPDLDRIETTDFSLGGADDISGGADRDFVLGGTRWPT